MTRPKYLPRGSRPPLGKVRTGLALRPVFGIDIDGTLGDYHLHFLRFAAGWLGVDKWPGPKGARSQGLAWPDDCYDGTCTLYEYMGVSKATYRRIKLAYRQGGLKRSMPAFKGASELTHGLRKLGAEVWICTTRPYLQVAGVEPDTREWLRRNRIQCDGVLAGEHKYRTLRRLVGHEQIVAVLDDLPEQVLVARRLGLPVLTMGAPHNAWFMWSDEEKEQPWTNWFSPDNRNPNPPLLALTEMLVDWESRLVT